MTARSRPSAGQAGLRRKAFFLAFGIVLIGLAINTLFGDHGVLHLLAEQRRIATLEQTVERLQLENAHLAVEIAALRSDPAAVERLAREELDLAAPGETVFLIHHPRDLDGY